jgi:hypothetical protein
VSFIIFHDAVHYYKSYTTLFKKLNSSEEASAGIHFHLAEAGSAELGRQSWLRQTALNFCGLVKKKKKKKEKDLWKPAPRQHQAYS